MLRRIGLAGVLIVFSAALAAAQTSTGTSELKIHGRGLDSLDFDCR
jgi:hypothetical protein